MERAEDDASRVPPPEGFELRVPRTDEAEAVARMMMATEAAAVPGVAPETSVADVESEWRGMDVDRDHWVLVGGDGTLAAYAALYERGDDHPLADVYVHPDRRGLGLGSFLVSLTEEDMRRRMRETRRAEARLLNPVMGTDVAARSLLEARGYKPVRHFYRMAIRFQAELPAPMCPPGFVIRALDPEQVRDIHAAIEEAFAEEWGHSPEPFDQWKERKDREGWDPSLCFVAFDGSEIAGVVQCSARFGGGWINALGVLPRWRKRGLGRCLLLRALHEFQRRGESKVALGVDASNPTGATRVYERAGMMVEWKAVVFEKRLRSEID